MFIDKHILRLDITDNAFANAAIHEWSNDINKHNKMKLLKKDVAKDILCRRYDNTAFTLHSCYLINLTSSYADVQFDYQQLN